MKTEYDICSEPNCFNVCFPGTILCVGHLYGFPQRASEEAINWKLRKQREHIDSKLKKEPMKDRIKKVSCVVKDCKYNKNKTCTEKKLNCYGMIAELNQVKNEIPNL